MTEETAIQLVDNANTNASIDSSIIEEELLDKVESTESIAVVPEIPERKLSLAEIVAHHGPTLSEEIETEVLQPRYSLPKASFDLEILKVLCCIDIDDFDRLGQRLDTPDGSFIYINRGGNILAVAHRDTVCKPKHFKYSEMHHVVATPTLDDRLGCTILLDVLDRVLPKGSYDILLTEGEESGRSTARYFVPPVGREYNWMFQFDRGGVDAVHYQYTDPEWLTALKTDMDCKIEAGMLSDICYLERLGVCGVNVGTAYYQYHSVNAHARLLEAEMMVDKFAQFFMKYKDIKFEHDEENYGKNGKKQHYTTSSYNQGDSYRHNQIGYVSGYSGAQKRMAFWDNDEQEWVDSWGAIVDPEDYEGFTQSNNPPIVTAAEYKLRKANTEATVPMKPKGHIPSCNCPVCVNVRTYEARVIAERHKDVYFDGCMCASCRNSPHRGNSNRNSEGGVSSTSTDNSNDNNSTNFPTGTKLKRKKARKLTKQEKKQLKQQQRQGRLEQLNTNTNISGAETIQRNAWQCSNCKKPTNVLTAVGVGCLWCDECVAKGKEKKIIK